MNLLTIGYLAVDQKYGKVILKIYQIRYSGELPENWTLDTLLKKHLSKPYNPAIANVFFLAGYVESWGRGIEKITNESKSFNNIEPKFRWDSGLWVEFDFNKENKSIDKLGDKLGDRVLTLSKNRMLIIKYMFENHMISIPQLSDKLNISTTAIENNIKYLKENHFIKRVGGTKKGSWEIINEPK